VGLAAAELYAVYYIYTYNRSAGGGRATAQRVFATERVGRERKRDGDGE